jgi:hypothetical protein
LVVRVQLRGLQPDPYPETAGAERVKQRSRPSVPPMVAERNQKNKACGS